jgi:DnaJ-class molecular chaperone
MPTYYEILGVSPQTEQSEIKAAFRKLSLIHHPDRGGDTSKFQEINQAFETLSDPQKRQQYDMELNGIPPMGMGMGGMGMGMPHPDELNNLFGMLFGKGGLPPFMQGGGGMHFMHTSDGPGVHVFHGGMPHEMPFMMHQQHFQKPHIITHVVKISLEQAYNGLSLPIEIERWVLQPTGTKTTEKETIYITLPPGIDDNENVIISEKGNVMDSNCKGDLKIVVSVENNTPYKREGLDLLYEKTITLKEALCGFSFELCHINGKQLALNSNNKRTIITPGFRQQIPNLGMNRGDKTGKLIIIFTVEFPAAITDEQAEQLDKIL